jgi:hypothetical protein
MRGKRGFLRILEAFVAIAIIAGVLSFLYVTQVQRPDQESARNELIRIILERIQSDNVLRGNVLTATSDPLNDNIINLESEISKLIPEGELDYHFSICPLNSVCGCGASIGGGNNCPSDETIFSDEVSISVTLESATLSPKVIRLFIWER